MVRPVEDARMNWSSIARYSLVFIGSKEKQSGGVETVVRQVTRIDARVVEVQFPPGTTGAAGDVEMTIDKLTTQILVGQVRLHSLSAMSISGRAPVAMRRALESRFHERRNITLTLSRHEWPRGREWPKRWGRCVQIRGSITRVDFNTPLHGDPFLYVTCASTTVHFRRAPIH